MNEITAEKLLTELDPELIGTLNRWLARGDGVAVYVNQDLSSPNAGHRKFVSFGSEQSLLGTGELPKRLPDTNVHINWRYFLEGTYRGALLPEPPPIAHYTGSPINNRRRPLRPTLTFKEAPTVDAVTKKLAETGVTPKQGWMFQYWAVREGAKEGQAEGPYYVTLR